MAMHEEGIRGVLPYEDTTVGYSADHPLARELSERTGMPTVVVEADDGVSPEEAAMRAARVASAVFGLKHTGANAAKTIASIDEVLRENTAGGNE
jgi:DNA-directed RNA polymerase subunit L